MLPTTLPYRSNETGPRAVTTLMPRTAFMNACLSSMFPFVERGHAADRRDLAPQAVFVELAQIAEAVRSGETEKDAVGVGLELREVRAIVGHGERRKSFLDDLATELLEHALEARAHLVAVGDVVGDRHHAPELERVVAVIGERMGALRGGGGPAGKPGIQLALRHVLGRRDRKGQQLRLADVVVGGKRLGGSQRPDHDVDAVALDQLLDLGARLRGHAAAVADEELHFPAGHRVIALLQVLDERALHVDAARGERAGLHRHEPYANRSALSPDDGRKAQRRCAEPSGLDEAPAGKCHGGFLLGVAFQWVGFWGASGCFAGCERSKAPIFMHSPKMRMTVGTPAVPTLKNFAPKTWEARQMSASVGASPWQYRPVSLSLPRCSSSALSASSVQCASHLLRAVSSWRISRSRYPRIRGTTSGCPSLTTICARPRTRALPRGSFGSSAGVGCVSSRYSRIAIDWKSGAPPSITSAGTTLCGLTALYSSLCCFPCSRSIETCSTARPLSASATRTR